MRVSPIACRHLAEARPVRPRSDGCEECLALGQGWVELRMCLTCGHVGCCDSSPGKHGTQHFRTTAHPLMRSIDEGWTWCYIHEVIVSS